MNGEVNELLMVRAHLEKIMVAESGTHHVRDGQPIYEARFSKVLKFHPPGLAAVQDASGSFHITLDGSPAYVGRFVETWGFYDGLAAVRDVTGCYHILSGGEAAYPERYAWCGNYQCSRVSVRDTYGHYFHLDRQGKRTYAGEYLYAGDYRDGIACVRRADGLCIHIDLAGSQFHPVACLDLDVFHKGFARARDGRGWFHMLPNGNPAYQARFDEIEPFYNGQAFCREWAGRRVLVDERGRILHVLWEPAQMSQAEIKAAPGRIIVVVGNCCAGKTTLARNLGERLGIPAMGIDDFRRGASDGSTVGELRAWQQFLEAVKTCFATGAVIEFSGSGHMAHLVKLTLDENGKYSVIWLRASPEVCHSRASSRPVDVPYPRFGVSIEGLIPELHARLEREFAHEEIWPASRVHIIDGAASPPAVLTAALASMGGAL